ncbi:hypothetical protein DFS33DRAFT_1268295, partial [Desarmillaria ectypa]
EVTGAGDFTKVSNVRKGDPGGELDPHVVNDNGNPGKNCSQKFGIWGHIRRYHEWTSFILATEFCFRACAATNCQHICNVMGWYWVRPINGRDGSFTLIHIDSTCLQTAYLC